MLAMSSISLEAQERKTTGHGLEALRSAGQVPAITYGHGEKSASIQVKLDELERVYSEAGTAAVIELTIGKETKNVVIYEVQRDPVTGTILHADFYQVRMDEKIKTEVPVKFKGKSAAVKDLGGILVKAVNHLEVEALPKDLPREIIVDLSTLKTFDDHVALADLAIPAGVEVLVEDKKMSIASVTPPRSEEELKALDEEVTEDVEAVEGVKEPEEGEDVTDEEAEGEGEDKEGEGEAEGADKEGESAAPEKPKAEEKK